LDGSSGQAATGPPSHPDRRATFTHLQALPESASLAGAGHSVAHLRADPEPHPERAGTDRDLALRSRAADVLLRNVLYVPSGSSIGERTCGPLLCRRRLPRMPEFVLSATRDQGRLCPPVLWLVRDNIHRKPATGGSAR